MSLFVYTVKGILCNSKAYTFVPSSHIGMMNFPSDSDTFPLTLKLSSMISFCVIGNELLNIFLM